MDGMTTPTTPRPCNGILWEDAVRVVIATGVTTPTTNRKTGSLVQIWILPKGGLQRQPDVCLACPRQPRRHGGDGTCYVVPFAPASILRAWRAGQYPYITPESLAGLQIRFGAWGDPSLIPLSLVKRIAEVSAGWTAYTHAWRPEFLQGFRAYFMASVDSPDEQVQAAAMGWRTFRVAPTGGAKLPTECVCPASAEAGARRQCAQCMLCGGAAVRAKSIVIQQH